MTFTLLMVGGAAAAMAVRAIQPVECDRAATTPEPRTECVEGAAGTGQGGPPGWNLKAVASLAAAQDLLDWLEAQGYAEREMVVLGNASFAVRWR